MDSNKTKSSLLLDLKLLSNNNYISTNGTCSLTTTPSSPNCINTIKEQDDLSISSTSSLALSSSSSSNCSSSSPSSQSPPHSLCFKLKEEEKEENDILISQITTSANRSIFFSSFARSCSARVKRNKSQSFSNLTNSKTILTKKFSFSTKQQKLYTQQEVEEEVEEKLIANKSKSMNRLFDLPLTSSLKMFNWFKDFKKKSKKIDENDLDPESRCGSVSPSSSGSSSPTSENMPDTSSTSSIEITNDTNDDFETKMKATAEVNSDITNITDETVTKQHHLPPVKYQVNNVAKTWSSSSSSSTSSSASSSPSSISYLLPSYSFASPKSNKSQLNFSRSVNNNFTSTIRNTTNTHSLSRPRFDPRSVQKIVLEWCQLQTKDYKNVNITNFSSSWSDGLAFCALIHSFLPNSFDYNKLESKNRYENFELAFEVALKEANIAPLLEVADMIKMGNRPDDRCVYTYVSTIYSRFKSIKSATSKS